nr:retrovirus-related Pol polyprotein LINE-1 [Tanacetum cinerariifolium]
MENIYKVAKREAKIAVTKAKEKAYEDLYKKLDSKEGVNEIYKIANARERRRRDIRNVKYIKDEGGRTISRPEGSREVGRSSSPAHFDCYYSRINHEEVRAALQKMGRNKAVGPDQIPIEAWRGLGDEGVKWLTCLFNKIFSIAKMPDEWRLSEVIPVYKNKGDAQACSNYRDIKLLSYTMKLWERVIGRRLRRESRVSENQFGFMPGRSTTEAIHLLRSLMENYRERQRDLHMAFLDLEKAYDSVPRELVWKILLDKGIPRRYSKVIKDMYEGAKTRVRTTAGNTKYFSVNLRLHQGSAISPYLFTLILDELSRGIQENIPWCM